MRKRKQTCTYLGAASRGELKGEKTSYANRGRMGDCRSNGAVDDSAIAGYGRYYRYSDRPKRCRCVRRYSDADEQRQWLDTYRDNRFQRNLPIFFAESRWLFRERLGRRLQQSPSPSECQHWPGGG